MSRAAAEGAAEALLTGRSTARGSSDFGFTARGAATADSGLTARVIACQSWRADGGNLSQSFAASAERASPFAASLSRSSSAPLASTAGGSSCSQSRLLFAADTASPSIYVKSSSVHGARLTKAPPQVQWKFNQGINPGFSQSTRVTEDLAKLSFKGSKDTTCRQIHSLSMGVDHKSRWSGGPNRYINGALDWSLRLNP